MKRSIVIACVLALLSPIAHAMTVEEVPNPQEARGSFVEDSAGVLGPEYISLRIVQRRKLRRRRLVKELVASAGAGFARQKKIV
jgi:hypothetical protein